MARGFACYVDAAFTLTFAVTLAACSVDVPPWQQSDMFACTTGGSDCAPGFHCEENYCVPDSNTGSAWCGNQRCETNETCLGCPSDCGNCGTSCDYDGRCEQNTEGCGSCPADCGSCMSTATECNHDGQCSYNESCTSCPSDCFCNLQLLSSSWQQAQIGEAFGEMLRVSVMTNSGNRAGLTVTFEPADSAQGVTVWPRSAQTDYNGEVSAKVFAGQVSGDAFRVRIFSANAANELQVDYRVNDIAHGTLCTLANPDGGQTTTDNSTDFADGAPSLQAALEGIEGVAVHPTTGDVYVSETNRCRVVRLSRAGALYHFAGTGLCNFSGDDGPATEAELQSPGELLVRPSDNSLIVVDRGNQRLRRISLDDGFITTLAGGGVSLGDNGPANNAQLAEPRSIALLSNGELLVLQAGSSDGPAAIRRINSANIITTDALNISAHTRCTTAPTPVSGLAAAATGTGYLFGGRDGCDSGVVRLWRRNSDGTVVPLTADAAGDTADNLLASATRLTTVESLAFDARGNLYFSGIASQDNMWPATSARYRVRRMTKLTRLVQNAAGSDAGGSIYGNYVPAISGHLNDPRQIAFTPKDDLLIADRQNHALRLVRNPFTTQAATEVWVSPNTATARSATIGQRVDSPPLGVQVSDLAGFSLSGVVTEFTCEQAGCWVDTPNPISNSAGSASTSVIIGANDLVPPAAYRFTAAVRDLAGNVVGESSVTFNITANPLASHHIFTRLNITAESSTDNSALAAPVGPAAVTAMGTLSGVAATNNAVDKTIYVASDSSCVVMAIHADDSVTRVAGTPGYCAYCGDGGPATSACLAGPSGLALADNEQSLIIADTQNNRVRKVDLLTGVITTVAGNGSSASYGDNGLATQAGVQLPTFVASAPGILFLVENNHIRKVDSAGIITTVFDLTGATTCPSTVNTVLPRWGGGSISGIATSSDGGYLLFAAPGCDYTWNTSTMVWRRNLAASQNTAIAGCASNCTGSAAWTTSLTDVKGLHLVADDALYFTEASAHRVRALDNALNTPTNFRREAGNSTAGFYGDYGLASYALLSYPFAVAVQGSLLYITDHDNRALRAVNRQ